MSIQAISLFYPLGPPNTGTVSVPGVKAGDKIVSIQSVPSAGEIGGTDMSSYFSSTVSTDNQLQQTSAVSVQVCCLAVFSRGY